MKAESRYVYGLNVWLEYQKEAPVQKRLFVYK
jgi:hypothetical protein